MFNNKLMPLVLIIALCLIVMHPIVMEAKTRGISISVKDRSGNRVSLYNSSHALLVGVSNYTHGWPKLETIPYEMQKLAVALEKNGFKVETVIDPDSTNLYTAFSDFIDRYGYDENNRLLFFYSGHGYSNKRKTKGYLVPIDAPDPKTDRQGFRRKALNMTHILAWCKDLEAKHSLFLFDSCFSGTIFKTRALPKHPPHISSITASPVRQFISAGSAGEEVPAKSVFVPSFIRALRGDGDIDGDGYVTGTELGMYLHRKVMSYETGQTPQYGKIKDPDLDEGDFVFLLSSLGSTLESPAAKQKTTFLWVEGNVSGASLWVDGREQGTLPLSGISIQPGRHKILVQKPGYDPYQKIIHIKEGRSFSLFVDLSTQTPQKRRLYVDTDPVSARVRVLNIGAAFHQGIELAPGRYQVEISANGYENKKFWTTLSTDADKSLDITLRRRQAVATQSSPNKWTHSGPTIKLGVVGPHSGDLASYGIPSIKAAELVVKDINAKGGVLGKQVELVVEDDVCKPEVAVNAATKLVNQGVSVVLGHICSGATKAALGIYKDAGIVTMSPSATNPRLTQRGDYPNFFRTIAPDDAQAKLEVVFALDKLGLSKIAILHDKGDYGKGLAEFAKAFLESQPRARVVLYEGITPGAIDYSPVVQKIKRSRAEAVIFGGYHPEASKIITQMKKQRMKTIFISNDGVKDDTFIKVAGKYAEGVYATGPKDVSRNQMAIAASRDHQRIYGSAPGAFFLNAYAAALALLNAIEQAGSTDYYALTQTLKSKWVETPLGRIRFDEGGEGLGVGFAMYQVKNGRFVEIVEIR